MLQLFQESVEYIFWETNRDAKLTPWKVFLLPKDLLICFGWRFLHPLGLNIIVFPNRPTFVRRVLELKW